MTYDELHSILSRITFAPNNIEMGWKFVVRPVYGEPHRSPLLGWQIRTTFRRPDRDDGKPARGFGRWWFIPEDETVSGIVKTYYSACRMIVEHELMEAFLFDGQRIFDPHNTVDELASLQLLKRHP